MRARGRFAVVFFAASVAASVSLWACGGGGRERAAFRGSPRAAAAVPERRELSPLPRRELSPALARVRARVTRSASAARELPWLAEPSMTELTGWEYGTRAREMTALVGGDELRDLSRLAVAGGLLPEGTDLATLAASFAAASSAAVYSPPDRAVLLVADPNAKGARRADEPLLAHEFTHALQDQHFDLLRLLTERPYNFDRAEAAFAVVEGDAVAVQRRVEGGAAWARVSPDEAARLEDARFANYRREFGALFPALLTETFVFRYRDGLRLVETARRKSGARGADELFRRPPASSEQVLHPEKYFANEPPREVRADEAGFAATGWKSAVSTPLGEIGVRGTLLKTLGRREAERAAAGWGGDRAYLFEREGGAPLFVWLTKWDGPVDAREFFRAYAGQSRGAKAAGGVGDEAEGESQREWRGGAAFTVARLAGDSVLVVRGGEPEVRAALELARNF